MNLKPNLYLALLGCMAMYHSTRAQGILESAHYYFSGFDSSRISTNYLMDRSPWLSDSVYYHAESDSVSGVNHWFQLLMDLKNAEYLNQPGSRTQTPPSAYFEQLNEFKKTDVHPLGIILKKYNQIPEDRYAEITPEEPEEPFNFSAFNYEGMEEHTAFGAAILLPVSFHNKLNLLLTDEFLISDLPIDEVRIAIPDLNIETHLTPGEVFPVDLSELDPDYRILPVHLTVRSGSRLYRRTIHHKRAMPVEEPDAIIYNFGASNGCTIHSPMGFANARAYIVYSEENDLRIKKPLVIVEGYDPSHLDYGAINWGTFKTGKSYDHNGKEVYQQLAMLPDLLNELNNLDYDLILVDFQKAHEPLERNAAALARILNWVKANSIYGVDPVVIGASMGGILSQTAFNLLKQSGCQTCVNQFISFDSPYNGANIPIALQEATKFFYNVKFEATIEYEYSLNTHSAKQLLFYHINDQGERADWLNLFGAMDKHLATYNFGLVSSPRNINSNGLSPGTEILNWKVWSTFNLNTLVEIKMYTTGRDDNLVFYAKVPTHFRKLGDNKEAIPTHFSAHSATVPVSIPHYDRQFGSNSLHLKSLREKIQAKNNDLNTGVAKFGPYFPLGEALTFVPPQSAINSASNNLHYDLSGIDIMNPREYCPFDKLYFAEQQNYHVQITPIEIAAVVDFLTESAVHPTLNLPHTGVDQYNICKERLNSIGNVTIGNGGLFSVNDWVLSNDQVLPGDVLPQHNLVWVRTNRCGAAISCEPNGEFRVGGLSNNPKYKAIVSIEENSTLELHPDAVLRIRDHSQLIVEDGAMLILHPGAQIFLEGDHAVLEIRGKVVVHPGAKFSFTKGNATTGGFVRFNLPDHNPYPFDASLDKVEIDIQGQNFEDKVIEIAGNTRLELPAPNLNYGVIQFKIRNGKIGYDGEGKIDAYCPIYLEEASLTQAQTNSGKALITHGQGSIHLDYCRFQGFGTGLEAYNDDLGNDLVLRNCNFKYNSVGLRTIGRKTELDNCTFHGNGFAGLIPVGTQEVTVDNSEFYYNFIGIETEGSVAHLLCANSKFFTNDHGILDYYETPVTLRCNVFEANGTGIQSNGKVNLSPNYLLPGQSLGGENNTFLNNQTGLSFDNAECYLINGENNFAHINGAAPNYFAGQLVAGAYLNNWILDASGNYFEHIPLQGLQHASGTLYTLTGYFNGINGIPLVLSGPTVANINLTCFSLIRYYPNQKKPLEHTPQVYDFANGANPGQLVVYPNPVRESLNLEMHSETEETCAVQLFDVTGKAVYATQWSLHAGPNFLRIDLQSHLEAGVYLLRVSKGTRATETVRIIVHE